MTTAFIISFASAPLFSLAATPSPCVNSPTTIDRNACFSAELEATELLLEAGYGRALVALRKADEVQPMFQVVKALENAQAKWREFRAADCAFRRAQDGYGTVAASSYTSCMIDYAKARLSDLESIR